MLFLYVLIVLLAIASFIWLACATLHKIGAPIGTSQHAFLMGNLNGHLEVKREVIVPDSYEQIMWRNKLRFAKMSS